MKTYQITLSEEVVKNIVKTYKPVIKRMNEIDNTEWLGQRITDAEEVLSIFEELLNK